MINLTRLLISCLVFLLLALPAAGQEEVPKLTGSHIYKDGIHVSTGYGIIPPETGDRQISFQGSQGTGIPGQYGLYRWIKFADGRTVAYELVILPSKQPDLFEVALKPALLSPERLSAWKIDPASIDTRFLQKYPVPFTLGESEILAIEVAENKRTGQKFVDYYMVTRGAPFLRADLEKIEQEAREFRAEDAEISVMDFDLRVNGTSLQRSGGGVRGKFIWINIPDVGRFTFTLTPPPQSAGFEPKALVKGKQILFRVGEDRYEWLAKEQIAPGSGIYYLWMRHDPSQDSRFVRGASDGLPVP